MRTDFKEILFEIKENAAWITINRPEVRNAFREQTLDEMREAVLQTKEDVTISCIVFTGAGDEAFSAGGDFYAMKRLNWSNASHWNDRMLGLAMAIRGVSIPVIAMVNGWCMGGGHELALWCDMVIASENATLGQTGARVGACPTVGATQYQLYDETMKWVKQINSYSGQTIRQTKKSLNAESDELYASWQHGMELLAHVWGSEESLEGMHAFIEKRKPNFFKFREKNANIVKEYLDGLEKDENVKPKR